MRKNQTKLGREEDKLVKDKISTDLKKTRNKQRNAEKTGDKGEGKKRIGRQWA